jgi:RNA polymerase sigma-70 factor (ECF subfamily)
LGQPPDPPTATHQTPALRRAPGTTSRLTREAFAAEFTAVSRALWCIAAAIVGDRSRAEDVVQDAALAAMQKLGEFEPGTSFLAWMGRFVRYTALNEARKQRTRAAGSIDDVEPAVPESSGGVPGLAERHWEGSSAAITSRGRLALDQAAFDDKVLGALKALEETARACLLLRTVHDMSYKEIALALDLPEGTAMSHVHRARQAMRARLATDPSRRTP